MDIGSLTGTVELEDQLSGKLNGISARVVDFVGDYGSAMKTAALATATLVSAVTGAVASITALGSRGSVILGVEQAFDRLAESAGATGESLITGLSAGVRNTVDSMELMQSTTTLLNSGMQITQQQMELLGATARELGKATGTDAAQSLSTLSNALAMGNDRALRRLGINIDLVQAEKNFAASIGTTRDQLSRAGVLEARRGAMLEAMEAHLNRVGRSELTFKERIQQATVAVGNWFDELAKGVARSSAVSDAFDAIWTSLQRTFGPTSQTVLQTLLRGVDTFSSAVGRFGPVVVETLGTISDKLLALGRAAAPALGEMVGIITDTAKTIGPPIAAAFGMVIDKIAGLTAAATPALTSLRSIIADVVTFAVTKIQEFWQWLIDFNNRWQITATLVTAGKAAWDLLKGAFDLVKRAVEGVMAAWSAMPEWLRRITQTALEATAVMGIYAVAIDAVAAPMANLVGSIDTAINIFGNLTGAIYASQQLLVGSGGFVGSVGILSNNLAVLSKTMGLTAAATAVNNFAFASGVKVVDALLLAESRLIASYRSHVTALTATTTATYLQSTASAVLATAKGLLTGVVVVLTNSYRALIAALATTTFGMYAQSVAARVASVSNTLLAGSIKVLSGAVTILGAGLALLIRWVPVVAAAFAGWKLGPIIGDFVGISEWIERTSLKFQRFIGLISEFTTDEDIANSVRANTQARLRENAQAYDDTAEAARKLAEEEHNRRIAALTGDNIVDDLNKQRAAFAALTDDQKFTTDAFMRYGEALSQARTQGAALSESEAGLADQYENSRRVLSGLSDSYIKVRDASEEFKTKLRGMREAAQDAAAGFTDFRAVEEHFRGLTEAQRANADVQDLLVPKIHQLAEAHRNLSAGMVQMLNDERDRRLAFLESDKAALARAGVTQGLVDQMKRLGMTEADIARQYDVSTSALSIYLAAQERAVQVSNRLDDAQGRLIGTLGAAEQAMIEAGRAQREMEEMRRRDLGIEAGVAVSAADEEVQRMIRQRTMSATQFQIDQIERESAARIAAFDKQYRAAEDFDRRRAAFVAAEERRTTELINAQLIDYDRLRDISIETLGDIADKAENTYKEALRNSGNYSREAITHLKLVADASRMAFEGQSVNADALWRASRTNLQLMADEARRTYEFALAHSERYSAAAIRNFKRIADEAQAAADGTMTALERTHRVLQDFSGLLGQIPGLFGDIASSALRTADQMIMAFASGDIFGGIVAGAQAAISWIGKIAKATRDGRHAIEDFADTFDTIAPGSGFDELHAQLLALGPAGEQMWIRLTQRTRAGDLEGAKRIIGEIEDALESLDRDVQSYNLSWSDMVDAQQGGVAAGRALVASFERLTSAGFTADRVIKGMSADINAYIAASLSAGTKIPAAMRPIIVQLIQMGQLTDANAAAMLGLAEAGVPSLDEIRAAAERYGISLDALGPKVKQLEINELATQYVADWEILTAATDDWAVLIDAMRPKVQDLITDAIKYGLTLPASMKPMIQAFIDAGVLTDETGEKLTDLTKLTFAADLEEMFEDLIAKLDELIETISDGVGGALDDLGRRVVEPTIKYRYDTSGKPAPEFEPGQYSPEYAASGGFVTTTGIVPLKPRGTDTIPAMLTPGETIIPVGAKAVEFVEPVYLGEGGRRLFSEEVFEPVFDNRATEQHLKDVADITSATADTMTGTWHEHYNQTAEAAHALEQRLGLEYGSIKTLSGRTTTDMRNQWGVAVDSMQTDIKDLSATPVTANTAPAQQQFTALDNTVVAVRTNVGTVGTEAQNAGVALQVAGTVGSGALDAVSGSARILQFEVRNTGTEGVSAIGSVAEGARILHGDFTTLRIDVGDIRSQLGQAIWSSWGPEFASTISEVNFQLQLVLGTLYAIQGAISTMPPMPTVPNAPTKPAPPSSGPIVIGKGPTTPVPPPQSPRIPVPAPQTPGIPPPGGDRWWEGNVRTVVGEMPTPSEQGGALTVTVSPTFEINTNLEGAVIRDDQDATKIALAIANEIRTDPRVREQLGTQIVNVVEQAQLRRRLA